MPNLERILGKLTQQKQMIDDIARREREYEKKLAAEKAAAEEANDAAELKRRKEAEKAAQKQKEIANELDADGQQAIANTKSTKKQPVNAKQMIGAALVTLSSPAQAIESLIK